MTSAAEHNTSTNKATRLTDEELNQVRIYIHRVGCDLVPCNSRLKNNEQGINWIKGKWGDIDYDTYDESKYEKLLLEGWFDDGVCIINGLIRRGALKGKYIATFDFDTKAALEKFCEINGSSLEQLTKWTCVEWHGDDDSYHVFVISGTPFKNVNASGFETKANKVLTVVSPSVHPSGKTWEVYQNDNESIAVLDQIDKLRLEAILEASLTTKWGIIQVNTVSQKRQATTTLSISNYPLPRYTRGRDIMPRFLWQHLCFYVIVTDGPLYRTTSGMIS
jgi:hypothetical protein